MEAIKRLKWIKKYNIFDYFSYPLQFNNYNSKPEFKQKNMSGIMVKIQNQK